MYLVKQTNDFEIEIEELVVSALEIGDLKEILNTTLKLYINKKRIDSALYLELTTSSYEKILNFAYNELELVGKGILFIPVIMALSFQSLKQSGETPFNEVELENMIDILSGGAK
ncbi:hypothetical protein [Listeria newyorkensis]|uniref:hypothetical protein n=1 Tax=Listeria newyorkensis TaxID=1497681 RepID=UPI00051CDDA7|nr:hypothetical protein [Listeria newyorkensis]KGL45731.1 hypothetical protein EP58_03310 [Listeria newyorkensis]SQC55331.1 Uncharacterised protein [Listeria newyorkensis]